MNNQDLLKRSFLSEPNLKIIKSSLEQTATQTNKSLPNNLFEHIVKHANGTFRANSKKPNNISLEDYLLMLNKHTVKVVLSKLPNVSNRGNVPQSQIPRPTNTQRTNNPMPQRNQANVGKPGLATTGPLGFDKVNSRKSENLSDDYNRQLADRKLNKDSTSSKQNLPDFLKFLRQFLISRVWAHPEAIKPELSLIPLILGSFFALLILPIIASIPTIEGPFSDKN